VRVWWPYVVGLAVCVIAIATVTPTPVGVFWDDGVYLITAKSLAAGTGYRFIHLVGAPPAVHFPPAWPALLALVWMALPEFPQNVAALKFVNPVLLAIAAAMACAYAIRRFALPPAAAVVTTIVFAAALPVLVLTNVLFSEPLFLVVLFVALAAADRAVEQPGWRASALAGLSAGALALVRSLGIALVPALIAALLLAKRWRDAAVAAIGATVVMLPWQLWVSARTAELAEPLRGNYGPYLGWVVALYHERGVGFAATIVRQNVRSLYRSIGIVLFPAGPQSVRPLLVTITIVLVAVAMIRAHRRARAALLFLVGYAAIVLPWPYPPERFLWAVWPLAGLLLASGAVECWRLGAASRAGAGGRASAALVCAVGVFSIGGHAVYSFQGVQRHWWDRPAMRNAQLLAPVAEWINANTQPGDVVACDGEPFVNLYTGRTVVPVHILSPDEYFAGTPLEQAAADLRVLFITSHPRYAVLSAGSAELAAVPLLDGADGTPRLEPLATLPGGGAAFRVIFP
jgi:hypothetical protein